MLVTLDKLKGHVTSCQTLGSSVITVVLASSLIQKDSHYTFHIGT